MIVFKKWPQLIVLSFLELLVFYYGIYLMSFAGHQDYDIPEMCEILDIIFNISNSVAVRQQFR